MNKKTIEKNEHILVFNEFTIFNTKDNVKKLKKLKLNSKNFQEAGFDVSIGTIIWNKHKDILTNDISQTRLFYNTSNIDLIPNKLNFIKKNGVKEPVIIINRGYGTGKYKFDFCLVDINDEYLLENHIISVRYSKNENRDVKVEMLKRLLSSLRNDKTKQFIDLYFGNCALNSTEVSEILPFY